VAATGFGPPVEAMLRRAPADIERKPTMDEMLRRAPDIHAIGYFGVLIVVLLVESVMPRRRPAGTLGGRWLGNVLVAVADTVIVRAAFPIAALALSVLSVERGWGLLNVVALPIALEFVMTVLLLDLVVYIQHYLLHRIGFLWRAHRAHHTDPDFDVTTALRFHPLESLYSTSLTLLVILGLGAPPLAVLAWQVLSAAQNFLEHANVRVPARIDRVVRLLLVTPDMHRIHHSAAPRESRANFANIFSFWDRLFGTYLEDPASGHERMVLGLDEFSDPKHLQVHWILAQPFLAGRTGPRVAVVRPTAKPGTDSASPGLS
jgi:sterol desaturase/sphingolipid hydroxylase (fatty acid hydroxylase superfamily)